MNTWTKYRNS